MFLANRQKTAAIFELLTRANFFLFCLCFFFCVFFFQYVFVSTSRIPERTDASVAIASSSMLTPFVVFRLLMSCWMFSNTSIWQGVNLIDSVLQWVLVNVLGNTDSNLDSATLISVLSCGTGSFGYISIRAIMTVPHLFLLCVFIVLSMLINRLIVPTMGSCLLGIFPCCQKCCSGNELDEDDNVHTFEELVNTNKISGPEKFDFKSLEQFQDDIAAELDEENVKATLKKDIKARRSSNKNILAASEQEQNEEKIQANDQNEDEHFEVVNTKFEQVDTSDEEDDDGDY